MDERKRIAIYGGTFDPVHLAHLKIAASVSEIFAINEFLFVPARMAPHKMDRAVSSGFHRYAMLALATADDPRMSISSYELEENGSPFTVDTLSYFRAKLGQFVDLFFVMGLDSWSEINTWRDWKRLLTLANLIVVSRPGFEFTAAHVGSDIAASVLDLRGKGQSRVMPLNDKRIFITDAVMMDVSATAIRAASGDRSKELEKMVPRAVAEYIKKYRLYRNNNDE